MATRRKRSINFLPTEQRSEQSIDISAYPVDIGVGELLRLTRERLGHELQSVANQLRIRLSYLEAIEESRFRDLPGTTYAIGFVRSYADYLGLDGPDIVRRFREEAARIHGRTKLVFPNLAIEGKIPRAAILLVSAVTLGLAYMAWYVLSSRQDHEVPVIAEVPDRLIALTPQDNEGPAAPLPIPGSTGPVTSPPALAPETPPDSLQPQAAAPSVGNQTDATESASMPTDSASVPAAPTQASSDVPPVAAPQSPVVAPALPGPAPQQPEPQPAAADPTVPVPPAPLVPPAPPEQAVQQPELQPAAEVPSVPAAPAQTASLPSPVTAPETTGGPLTAEAATPSPPQTTDSSSSIVVESIPPAPSTPSVQAPEQQQQAALAGGPKDVVLEARMDSWIKVVDANGKTVTNQVLKAGERYVVPDQPGLILRTGNAGGLDVLVGGLKTPPLGEVGEVHQKILLDPDRLLNGTAGSQ